jgi:23S rRNA (guanosine2251-2'-O)-methyltransferase
MAGQIVYGLHAVEEAILSGHRVNRVYLAGESHAKGCKRVLDKAKQLAIPVDSVPQAKLNEITGTQDHQGIAAAISPVEYAELGTVLSIASAASTIVVLDQIQHPKNLGMIIRIAAGAGAQAVVIPKRGSALIDDSVVRASAGTVFRIPIALVSNLGNTLRNLKDAGYWVYGLDAQGDATVMDVAWAEKCVLVVGNESTGLRSGTAKACDQLVSIPLENEVESLNAAVATGIALYQMKSRTQPK